MALQATNAGIDYQCRISAWFLLNMLFENKLAQVSPAYPESVIIKAQLEGNTEIDDLIITFESKEKFYYQIKRTISFSNLDNSEFYKVINQFVNQNEIQTSSSRYILATSSKSSNKIINDLKRILDSIRASSIEDAKYQFNKADNKLWNEFEEICKVIYNTNTGLKLNDIKLLKLVQRIYIEIYDIEEGDSFERLIYLFISRYTKFDSKLLWSSLIKYALTLATNRRSITLENIKKEYKRYIDLDSVEKSYNDSYVENFDVSYVWKDYIVASSEKFAEMMGTDASSLFIYDVYRFNEEGKKDFKFELPDNLTLFDNVYFKVLHRSSSLLGVERFLKSNSDNLDEYSNIIFAPSKYSDNENTFEQVHLEWTKKELTKNINEKTCIVCGDSFNDNNGYIIEIDNTFEPNEVGLCHVDCLRTVDRIMGVVGIEGNKLPAYLKGIDINKWIELIKDGQAMVASLSAFKNSIYNVVWDPNYGSFYDGKYCIRTKLENGDYVYTKDRGKVDRLSKQAAKRLARDFNEKHKKAYNTRNPICYSSKTLTYGPYEGLITMVDPSEKLIPCIETEIVKYSKHISKLYNTCENFYAPLIMFYLDEEVFKLGDWVPFLSNILDIEEYFDSWGMFIGGVKPFIDARVIENDSDFDNIVRELKSENLSIVINPRLGRNNELISGAILYSLDELKTNK